MILGLGIDLVENSRIARSLEKFGDKFLARILTESEMAYCKGHKDPAPFAAARFAAKEAVSKAFGTGIGPELGWHDIEIGRRPSGEPFVTLHGKGDALLKERGAQKVHVSITHTQSHSAAVALLES